MVGGQYKGQAQQLPDFERPPLPPGVAAGGHGGSHGHLTHEFITAILENREPMVNVYEALAMTVPGILAHQSAMKNGETLKVPQYDGRESSRTIRGLGMREAEAQRRSCSGLLSYAQALTCL